MVKGEVIGSVFRVHRDKIRPMPGQPRTYFNQRKLLELSASIKAVGQLVPIIVREVADSARFDYELTDGQRRWHAIGMCDKALVKCVLQDDDLDPYTASVVANFGRAEHTPLEVANAIQKFKDRNIPIEQIKDIFGMSLPWVYQHLKLLKLVPEVQAMMDPDLADDARLNMSVALHVADVPPEQQLLVAMQILNKGMKAGPAKHMIRQRGAKMGFQVGSKRGPSDDMRVLRRHVGRVKRELEVFEQFDDEFLAKMAKGVTPDAWAKFIKTSHQNIVKLGKLTARMEKARTR